jgi:hypothetical protein
MPDPVLDNPLSFTPNISRRGKVMYLPVWKDNADVPLMNKAKQLLIKPVYEPFAVQLIIGTMAKRQSETDAYCRTYNNKVCSGGGWRAWSEGMCWVMDISSDPAEINGEEVDEVQVTVACLDRKWNTMAPNVGYNYKDGSDLVTFTASDGLRFIGKLDDSGGEAGINDDLIILEWDTKQSVGFGGLGF